MGKTQRGGYNQLSSAMVIIEESFIGCSSFIRDSVHVFIFLDNAQIHRMEYVFFLRRIQLVIFF